MSHVIDSLRVNVADTYAVYLKTQNFHWHVKGVNFKELHILFEEQYTQLANLVDVLAERVVTLGGIAPATFEELNALTCVEPGNPALVASKMLTTLASDHKAIIGNLNKTLKEAQNAGDEGTVSLIGEHLIFHEKTVWMLESSSK